jgi:hypothetical protein
MSWRLLQLTFPASNMIKGNSLQAMVTVANIIKLFEAVINASEQ